MSFSLVVIYGNVGTDPQAKVTPNGVQISEFRMAYETGYGDSAKVHWISVNAYGKTADFCNKYLMKGSPIIVMGKLVIDEWVSKEGAKMSTPRIYADSVQVTKGGREQQTDGADQGERRGGGGGGRRQYPNSQRQQQAAQQPPGFGRRPPHQDVSGGQQGAATPPDFPPQEGTDDDMPF